MKQNDGKVCGCVFELSFSRSVIYDYSSKTAAMLLKQFQELLYSQTSNNKTRCFVKSSLLTGSCFSSKRGFRDRKCSRLILENTRLKFIVRNAYGHC